MSLPSVLTDNDVIKQEIILDLISILLYSFSPSQAFTQL